MEPRLTDRLRVVVILSVILSTGSGESDRDLKFCGTWRHSKTLLSLSVNLSPGCKGISISADENTLAINGQITAQCLRYEVIPLHQIGLDSEEEINFCLYWEPLLDQLKLQLGERNLTLCWPASLQGSCCTYLSDGPSQPEAPYGIINGMVRTDFITHKTRRAYNFSGAPVACNELCQEASHGPAQVNMIKGTAEDLCTRSFEVEMKEDFGGCNLTTPGSILTSEEPSTTVHLPPALKQAAKETSKVVCTFFKNNSLFQEGQKNVRILNDVVGISVENEVITDLPEPIRIGFHHEAIAKMHSRKCVSWDTRKDPLQVNWLVDGCVTLERGDQHTECHCNHLTYFSVLVQLEPRPVRHLLALTVITSVGCVVSAISCVALIIFLCKKSIRCKDQSTPIHLGLAVSLALLNLLFFFTGILANIGGESLCTWVGAGLHYALLSSFSWMAIEVFHTFWLVYMVFSPLPKGICKLWSMVGFGLPAVPIIILAAVGDIYGLREVVPSNDVSNPYVMCWMKATYKALLAHYFTNMTILVVLVSSGFVMLFLVYRKIHTRDEWKQSRVAFLSIWGLSCLYGTTWGLTFLDFGPLSDFVLFLSCILNSFQGFLLMLRFYMLEWMRKQAGGSAPGSNSTGSTRQNMLQPQEKS
ncbi:adhesion G-protein coupled receptor G1 isoform X2 [Trachinotus anak]|uniref:adhesion G-protein coupled receptor G1 isoform X2 n=1 Tax=Trachinotus anak TaxID=443729 RepID=UPI0039F1BE9C